MWWELFLCGCIVQQVVSLCEIAQEDQPFIIYMYSMGQKVTDSILHIYQDKRNHEIQPHSRILFSSNWFLTYRTDVRIITVQSKIKISLGRGLSGIDILCDRWPQLLCDCGMCRSRSGSLENQSGGSRPRPQPKHYLPGSFAEHEGTWRQEPVPDSGHTRQYRVHCCPTTDAAVH